jgi:threo-3-hydroxy-L-aspartate ammonia-lyase
MSSVSDHARKIDEIDVEAAQARLEGVAHRTPVFEARSLNDRLGARVFLKAENMQRVGAFKFRGAYNHVSALGPESLVRGVVASSSGNHAQALALAAQLHGSRATILMPSDAPASKRNATIAYGAEVVSYDRYGDDRDALTAELARQRGLAIVPPYDDPHIIAGAATVAAELLEDKGELDLLVVATGGGGLLAGCALAARARFGDIRIIGVEPEASDDWQRSIRAGQRVSVTVGKTIADGQQLSCPGELNFRIAQPLVEDVVTVSDAEIIAAMTFLFERCKLVCEPSGASALAALLAGRIDVRGLRVGVTLSGGNIDTARFTKLVGTP